MAQPGWLQALPSTSVHLLTSGFVVTPPLLNVSNAVVLNAGCKLGTVAVDVACTANDNCCSSLCLNGFCK